MLRAVVFFGLYTAAVLIGRLTRMSDSDVSLIWPAAGVSVLWLLATWNDRTWFGINAGLLALTATVLNLATGLSPVLAVGFAVANLVEALIIVGLFLRLTDRDPRLERPYDLAALTAATLAGVLVNLVIGFVAYATVHGPPDPPWAAGWAMRNAASSLVLLAFGLSLITARSRRRLTRHGGGPEFVVFVTITGAACAMIFLTGLGDSVAWAVLPLGIWAGLRFSTRATVWTTLGLATVVVAATVLRRGPFGAGDPTSDALTAQLFVIVQMVVSLALALYRDDRDALQTQNERSRLEAWAHSRRAEAARDQYAYVLDAVTEQAIVATDEEGRITVFNPGARRMLGYTEREMLGRTPLTYHLGEEVLLRAVEIGVEPGVAVFAHDVRPGRARHDTWTYVRKDGRRLSVHLTVSAMTDVDGAVTGFLGVATDITEQRRTQLALANALVRERRAVEQLQEVDRAKTEFVSTVSHELRTPVTSVLGYVELLRDGVAGEVPPEQARLLEVVDRNGRRLLALVEDLLTLSRLESGTDERDAVPLDLARVVREAARSVEALLRGRELRLDLTMPDGDLPITGDARQLERVVTNLLSNAIKFTPDGGRIGVRVDRDAGRARVSVQDTGIGVPEAEREQVFGRFFRSSRAVAGAIPGTGLGLSIVARIVEDHHGSVELSSDDGEDGGTTVTVLLPLAEARTGAADTEPAEPAMAGGP